MAEKKKTATKKTSAKKSAVKQASKKQTPTKVAAMRPTVQPSVKRLTTKLTAKLPIKLPFKLTVRPPAKLQELFKHMYQNFRLSLHSIQKDNERAMKRKRTGKEIAVIVIAIIMVVSILLPSFAVFLGNKQNATPTSFSSTVDIYTPQIETLQKKLEENPTSATDALALANEQYNYGRYAMVYAQTDEEKTQANQIMQTAADDFTHYLDLAGELVTFDEKNAVVTRALCNLYLDNATNAIRQLKDLLKETNFAPAWQGLGMIYESQGDTNKAIEAYQNALDAPQEAQQDVTSYCEQRLKALKAANANESGGAAALNNQLLS